MATTVLSTSFYYTYRKYEEVVPRTLKILNHSPQAAVVKQLLSALLNPMSSCQLQPQLLPNIKLSLHAKDWSFGEGWRKVGNDENTANQNSPTSKTTT